MKIVYETTPGRYRVEYEAPTSPAKQQYEWSPECHFGSLTEAKEYAQQLSNEIGGPARVVDTKPEGDDQ